MPVIQNIAISGLVKKVVLGGLIDVDLDNNISMPCCVSGRFRKYNVRILPGDRVDVVLNPFDLSKGRIIKRYITNNHLVHES